MAGTTDDGTEGRHEGVDGGGDGCNPCCCAGQKRHWRELICLRRARWCERRAEAMTAEVTSAEGKMKRSFRCRCAGQERLSAGSMLRRRASERRTCRLRRANLRCARCPPALTRPAGSLRSMIAPCPGAKASMAEVTVAVHATARGRGDDGGGHVACGGQSLGKAENS